jgi:hypothetical protein
VALGGTFENLSYNSELQHDMADFRRHTSNGPISRRLWAVVWVCVVAIGFLTAGATVTHAQVQIDQAESVASQLEGATQGQVVVTLSGDCKSSDATCDNVSRDDVLGLIPGTPSLQSSGSGNSAVVAQRGDDNEATIEQVGTGHEASITQDGMDNEAVVKQKPGDGLPGQDNLAVIVQNGLMNQTTVQQLGQNNRAGIRLVGDNNGIELQQTGSGNEYLLDFAGSDLGDSSSSTHQVSQLGSNNRLVQVGEGRMPFNVQQRGDGMRMVIRHSGDR